jgi:glycosyltransferase involved in cell wall biosynthesis
MTTLSAVIPATDGRPTLGRVVAAVEGAANGPEELIIVDRPHHLGPAAARNLGARQASGDVLVFVDADVEVHRDVFDRIRSAFNRDKGLAALFGSYDDDPAVAGLVSEFRNLLHHHIHQEGAGVATTFWAGLGAIRRDVFFDLGGFDEQRFPQPSIEDIELGMRLHASGGRILLDPAIQGKHLKEWTLGSMSKTDFLQRGVPWLQLVFETGSGSTALNLGWRNRAGTGAAVLLGVGLVRRKFVLAGGMVALMIALDRSFYALLLRRRGPRLLVTAVPLHVIHRLTSAAAVPVALTNHLYEKWKARTAR